MSKSTPENVPQGATQFTFVSDGIESAVRQAKAAAGDKNVYVMGGASIAQQCLKARLLDEMHLNIAPVLLGDGVRLFDHLGTNPIELEKLDVIDSPDATHVHYRIVATAG